VQFSHCGSWRTAMQSLHKGALALQKAQTSGEWQHGHSRAPQDSAGHYSISPSARTVPCADLTGFYGLPRRGAPARRSALQQSTISLYSARASQGTTEHSRVARAQNTRGKGVNSACRHGHGARAQGIT
jgi:hypothetical protein